MNVSNSRPVVGPVLFARGADRQRCRLTVLIIADDEATSSPVVRPMAGRSVAARQIGRFAGYRFLTHDFELPVGEGAHYTLDGVRHDVVTDTATAPRLAYVSCNGIEHGDRERAPEERNRLWGRLLAEHGEAPFALLLHGGDQLYADEASESHPGLAAWAASPHDERHRYPFDKDMERAAMGFFIERYLHLYRRAEVAPLLASVPSIMMWDDHDIFDGWGSHPASLLDSPVGVGLFTVARRAFLLFQRGLPADTGVPGDSLSYALRFPGFDIVVPDLRSERRPERVLGVAGRVAMERQLTRAHTSERLLLMSSVPLLGPRLGLVERLIGVVPRLRRYEDDLRDQWQSRAHRTEWRWLLERLDELAKADTEVTVLSGEIHLASRGEMPLAGGRTLHQLIASGIAHPAPSVWWARALGWLARLGEGPMPGRRVTLHALPGQRDTYVAERNYLVVSAARGNWRAEWELETSGRSGTLALSHDVDAGAAAVSSTSRRGSRRRPGRRRGVSLQSEKRSWR